MPKHGARIDGGRGFSEKKGGQFCLVVARGGSVHCGTDAATRFAPEELGPGTVVMNQWQRLAYTQDGTTHTFHYDHRGTVFALTDASQNVAQTYEHDAWGVKLSETGALENPIQYEGSGWICPADLAELYLSPSRQYCWQTGRWLARLPVKLPMD